jgi:DNA-binding GntR family transcriptional regulator
MKNLRSSLPNALYDQLRDDILIGALEVGQVLRQEEIAPNAQH